MEIEREMDGKLRICVFKSQKKLLAPQDSDKPWFELVGNNKHCVRVYIMLLLQYGSQ